MPSLREHLYVSRSSLTEAQHSAMHLVYLMVRCRSSPNDTTTVRCGLHTFNGLFNQFFNNKCDVSNSILVSYSNYCFIFCCLEVPRVILDLC